MKVIAIFQNKITSDFFWRIVYTISKQGLPLFIFLVAAKQLSVTEFGTYNFVFAIVYMFILLSDFGISTAASKYVAQHYGEREKVAGLLPNLLIILFLASALLITIIFLVGHFLLNDLSIYLLLFSPLIFLIPAVSLCDGIFRGYSKFRLTASISFLGFLLSLPLIYPLVLWYGIYGAIFSNILFYSILLTLYLLNNNDYTFKLNTSLIKNILKYSLIYGIAVVGYQIFSRTDVLFLGYYGYIDQIATYELLNKIFTIVILPFTLLGQVLAPRFTDLFYNKSDFKTIYNKSVRYSLYFLIVSIILAAICFFTIPFVLKIFFSEYYESYFSLFFLLNLIIFALHINSATIDHGIVIATGYAKIMMWTYSLLALVNIILNFVLLSYFGFIGVIYSTLICTFIMVVSIRLLFLREISKLINRA